MAEHDQPARANVPAGVLLENDHVKAMVATLRKNHALLDLPQATFDLVLPSLGPDAARVLTLELSFIENDILERQPKHDPYNDDGFGDFGDGDLSEEREELPYKKIHRLSTVPGGLDAAIKFLVRDVGRCAAPLSFIEARDACETADYRLQEFLERKLKHADKHGPKWCASRCQKNIKQLASSTELSNMVWFNDGDGLGDYNPTTKEVFERSHVILSTWHSREVGEMLAEKVAGHLLPPELVELIGEGMYEAERWKSRDICSPYSPHDGICHCSGCVERPFDSEETQSRIRWGDAVPEI